MKAPGTATPSYPGRVAYRVALVVGAGAIVAFALIGAGVALQEQRSLAAQAEQSARAEVDAIRVPLAQAAWEVDEPTMRLLLQPLVERGSIVELRLHDGVGDLVRARRSGLDQRPLPVARRWSIELQTPQDPGRVVATLEADESDHDLDGRLVRRLPGLLLMEALKVALVAALMLLLLNRQITRPLSRLAEDLDASEAGAPLRPLRLQRTDPARPDELDRLVSAINALNVRVRTEFDERLRAEARERDEASQRATILATVADGVLAFGRRGQLRYVNHAAVRLLDLDEADLEGSLHALTAATLPEWKRRFADLRAQSQQRATAATWRTLQLVRRRDGSELPVAFTAQALPSGPLGFIVTAHDLVAERQAEHALAESRVARAADQAKSEFLSRMSHELRTPLHAVIGLADALAAGTVGPVAPRQQELLARLRGAGTHLMELIGDLLDLSRIEAGVVPMSLHAMPLEPLLRESLALIGPAAAAARVGLHLEVDAAAADERALIDRTKMRQVLLNLLSNAVKYNRPGGQVWLRLRLSGDAALEIEVEDDGPGMTGSQLAKLFTPFERGGRERENIEGAGIGLVIARELIGRMNGRLACHSEAGRGSSFVVRLPRASPLDEPPAEDEAAPRLPAPEASGRVLVVEDDEVNRLLVSLYLGKRPRVQAVFAASLQEALRVDGAFDLALVDLNLDQHSGYEVREQLLQRWQHEGISCPRWIIHSADASSTQREQALAAGFDAYWVKPMGLDDFLERLDRVLAHAGPESA